MNESKRGIKVASSIKFTYKGKVFTFNGSSFRNAYEDVVKWLFTNGYHFNKKNVFNNYGKFYTSEDVASSSYSSYYFKDIGQGNFMLMAGNASQFKTNITEMLVDFGVKESDIYFEEFDSSKIKKFGEITDEEDFDLDNSDIEQIIKPSGIINLDDPETYAENPFGGKHKSSALCILGKSGTGKSTTTEIVLRKMKHKYEFIIPSSMEANSFIQYTGLQSDKPGSGYDISNLGELILRAKNDPTNCYTAVFDECHRSLSIKRIEEDLLQAISKKRNLEGKRFFTLDRVSKQLYIKPTEEFPTPLDTESGKIFIPDNFGFIFLSSNANNITRNPDFFNRVDITIFKEEYQGISNLTELPKEDKIPQSIRDKFDSAREHGEL